MICIELCPICSKRPAPQFADVWQRSVDSRGIFTAQVPSTIILPPITVRSHWQSKQMGIEVTVTRVNSREVSYIGVHGAICGSVPQWQFLQNFQPVSERKIKQKSRSVSSGL